MAYLASMQGKKTYTEKLFCNFQLSERVPQENIYRQLKEVLDLNFLYKTTENYYGTEGQRSIDPVVFFKLILVGYLENLNSDRKIINHSALRLDVLYFMGYDIDEELPWHSTLSRTRNLYGEEVFRELFQKVLSLCVSKGMVSGKRQAIDSAYIKANASMDSLIEKEILQDGNAFADELIANDENTVSGRKAKEVQAHHTWKSKAYKDQPQGRQKTSEDTFEDEREEDGKRRGKFLSNHTHYSPTDRDARISVKPGKPRQLTYTAQTSVDTKQHVITNITADYSDKRDSQSLEQALTQTQHNLQKENLRLEEVLADTGYSSGSALRFLKEQNITGYIPNFGQYKHGREGFVFNEGLNQYECVREGGNKAVLPHKRTAPNSNGYVMKTYRSSETVCKSCPIKTRCIGKSNFKKLDESIDKPLYDEMHERLQTRQAKIYKKLRSSTVEPVLGTLINFRGMKRIWARGIKSANKFMLGAAIAYNLKKWLSYVPKMRKAAVKAIEREITTLSKTGLTSLFHLHFNGRKFLLSILFYHRL